MDKYYVLVVGKGQTSRANLEALMEDHYYANGNNGILVLAFNERPSQGQVFASQLAKDKNKEVFIFASETAKFDGLDSASTTTENKPIEAAIKFISKEKSSVFILWNDEDTDCQTAIGSCNELKVKAYDLTDGLNIIKSEGDVPKVETPTIPKQEELKLNIKEIVNAKEEESEEDSEENEDEEEYEEEEEVSDDLYYGVQAFVKAVAKAIVEEVEKASKSSLKAPKA